MDLGNIRVQGTVDIRWPEGHPRENENPPALTEVEYTIESETPQDKQDEEAKEWPFN